MINSFLDEYGFLSNFWVEPSGMTNEHYYQAYKAANEKDGDWILASKTPGEAKRRGRQVKMRPDWDQVKDDEMLFCLREKFRNDDLNHKLLATGDQELIEGNHWHDNYWGICYCGKCDQTQAQNKLGKLLMQVRKEIRDAE